MKLIIQIPCHNEEGTLAATIADLPRAIDGIDTIEILVIDDGSNDRTKEVALASGTTYLIRNTQRLGLAKTFRKGLDYALDRNADIIVNTDADNQYRGADIARLVVPILDGSSDIVIGARPIASIDDFSFAKKILQYVGSYVVRIVSNSSVADAPSGFRAFSRDAAKQINIFSEYTYTLESIIQGSIRGLKITSIPIQTNPATRPSRLVKSMPRYIARSALTILRVFAVYRPFRLFFSIGFLLITPGLIIGLRFTYYYLQGDGDGHVQSIVLTAILLLSGTGCFFLAILAELISVNRRLLENMSIRLRNIEELVRSQRQ